MSLLRILASQVGANDTMSNNLRARIILMWICVGVAGCHDPAARPIPVAPSAIPQPVGSPTVIQPSLSTIAPNIGSIAGGAWGTITGSGFEPGAAVRLGADAVQVTSIRDGTTITISTKSHPAGTVDVVVTNPGGLSSSLANAYTFAPPDSFDFNGAWAAHAGPEYDMEMRFTIRDNVLVSLACGSVEVELPSPGPSVHNGEFSLGDEGNTIFGRIVSPVNASGTINVPGCIKTGWWADKSGATHSTAR